MTNKGYIVENIYRPKIYNKIKKIKLISNKINKIIYRLIYKTFI